MTSTEAFARCDAIVEGRFRVSWAYQAYVEPHAATAWIEPDGTLAVTAGTQGTFMTRNELAQIFGLPTTKVRVTGAPLGGAFGSKQVVIEPLVAGAALRLRKPVRLVLTRREDFAATNPAQGMAIDLRIGAARTGRFEALEARLTYDAGAYAESSWEWFATQLITRTVSLASVRRPSRRCPHQPVPDWQLPSAIWSVGRLRARIARRRTVVNASNSIRWRSA